MCLNHDYTDYFLRFGAVFDCRFLQELFGERDRFLRSRVDHIVILQILSKALQLYLDRQVPPRIPTDIRYLTKMKGFDFFRVFPNQKIGRATSTVFIVRVHDGFVELILQNIGRYLRFLCRRVFRSSLENVSLTILYDLIYSTAHTSLLL